MIVSNTHELTITSMWQYVNTRKCWLVDHYKIYNLTFMNFSKVCMVLKITKKNHTHTNTHGHYISYIRFLYRCTVPLNTSCTDGLLYACLYTTIQSSLLYNLTLTTLTQICGAQTILGLDKLMYVCTAVHSLYTLGQYQCTTEHSLVPGWFIFRPPFTGELQFTCFAIRLSEPPCRA